MQKTRPSIARLALMVVFALSCFAILTFLWVSFGGSVPLAAKGYEVKVKFPEATTLAEQADVRISGVPVGKVQSKQLSGSLTQATLRIDPEYAPLPADTRAILRQKTLLGETYVELTPGTRDGPKIADGGSIAEGHVADTVQLDEIFRTFDPKTRLAFREWMDQQGKGFRYRGADLNAALGNLAPFEQDANTILQILNEQQGDVRRLVSNTGTVFNALTARDGQLRSLIQNSNLVFGTTASRDVKLQQAFEAFPTFLDESRRTAVRVTQFAKNTNPLITQLRPAARQLTPTLIQLHGLAPDLKSLFKNLNPLITASKKGAPAVEHILNNARPLLAQVDPFLRNLNPMLDYLGLYKHEIVSFFALDAASAQAVDRPNGAKGPVHYLRTANPLNPENLAAYPRRLATNRSNPYPAPLEYDNHPMRVFGTYLCGTAALPTITGSPPPTGTLIPPNLGSIVQLPPAVSQALPPALQNLVSTYALGSGAAPPCVEQPPNGRLVGQTGKYAQVKAAPAR